jgi:hypothetical protein
VSFSESVFVNCPFDDGYRPMLRPLLFTVSYLGLKPRIALETLDSGTPRIQKIVNLIKSSRYAIHDLSRLQAQEKGEYYRLNMPLELGIDVGCQIFGQGEQRSKRCLILEEQRYRYQTAISDLSGSDIAVYGQSPRTLVAEVRNWQNSQAHLHAPGPTSVWTAFLEFMSYNYTALKERGFSDPDIGLLPIDELMTCIADWISRTQKPAIASRTKPRLSQ